MGFFCCFFCYLYFNLYIIIEKSVWGKFTRQNNTVLDLKKMYGRKSLLTSIRLHTGMYIIEGEIKES